MKASLLERQLLQYTRTDDLDAIMRTIQALAPQEKKDLNPWVTDTVIKSIQRYSKRDQAESAYALMVFIRAMRPYISASTMLFLLDDISTPTSSVAAHV